MSKGLKLVGTDEGFQIALFRGDRLLAVYSMDTNLFLSGSRVARQLTFLLPVCEKSSAYDRGSIVVSVTGISSFQPLRPILRQMERVYYAFGRLLGETSYNVIVDGNTGEQHYGRDTSNPKESG